MKKWYDKPTKIFAINKDIDYVMCIDENGNSNLTNVLKKIFKERHLPEDEKYFTITGCIFTRK